MADALPPGARSMTLWLRFSDAGHRRSRVWAWGRRTKPPKQEPAALRRWSMGISGFLGCGDGGDRLGVGTGESLVSEIYRLARLKWDLVVADIQHVCGDLGEGRAWAHSS